MLVQKNFWRTPWFVVLVVVALVSSFAYFTLIPTGRPGGTAAGLTMGILAGLIFLFEMLLWFRKKFRAWYLPKPSRNHPVTSWSKFWWYYAVSSIALVMILTEFLFFPILKLKRQSWPFVATKHWMEAHVWTGLLTVPLVFYHCGFHFGGELTTWLMWIFIVVIASGIWGTVFQNIIPRQMLTQVPGETVRSQVERVMEHHHEQILAQLEEDQGLLGGEEIPGIGAVVSYYKDSVADYLTGQRLTDDFRSAGAIARTFRERRMGMNPDAWPRMETIEEICQLRRQLDTQVFLHRWLHNWLILHLPLSIALFALLIVHIITAIKYL